MRRKEAENGQETVTVNDVFRRAKEVQGLLSGEISPSRQVEPEVMERIRAENWGALINVSQRGHKEYFDNLKYLLNSRQQFPHKELSVVISQFADLSSFDDPDPNKFVWGLSNPHLLSPFYFKSDEDPNSNHSRELVKKIESKNISPLDGLVEVHQITYHAWKRKPSMIQLKPEIGENEENTGRHITELSYTSYADILDAVDTLEKGYYHRIRQLRYEFQGIRFEEHLQRMDEVNIDQIPVLVIQAHEAAETMRQLSQRAPEDQLNFHQMMMRAYDCGGEVLHSIGPNLQAQLSLPGFRQNYIQHTAQANKIKKELELEK